MGTTVKDYHDNIKPRMKIDFAKEMKKIGTTNPDFTPDESGNVVIKNPSTGRTARTNVPFNIYKK